jgi:hypothetical protein
MTFYINAWLNRPNPFVSVCDRNNGEELIRFDTPELHKHMNNGDLCLNDFCLNDHHEQQLLVRELLLLRCCNVLSTDMAELSEQLKRRRPKVVPFPLRVSGCETQNGAQNDAQWEADVRSQ